MKRLNRITVQLWMMISLCTGASIESQAQISIYPMDMSAPGQEVYMATASALSLYDWPSTGAGMMWDFSALEESSGELIEYQSVSQTPFVYQFLFNNPFDPDYIADFALALPPLDIAGFISTTDNYSYYQTTSNHFAAVGQGSTINDFPVPSKFDPMDVIYELPLSYEDSFEGYSELLFEIPNQLTYKFKQNRYTEVDGWGTLALPSGTYECLRVKATLQITDSLVIPDLFINFELPRLEEVHYQWLASLGGPPVLDVTQIGGLVVDIQFQSEATRVLALTKKEQFVYPNPCTDKIYVESEPGNVLAIYDLQGNLVKRVINQQKLMDVSDLPNGVYNLFIGPPGTGKSQKLVVFRD